MILLYIHFHNYFDGLRKCNGMLGSSPRSRNFPSTARVVSVTISTKTETEGRKNRDAYVFSSLRI